MQCLVRSGRYDQIVLVASDNGTYESSTAAPVDLPSQSLPSWGITAPVDRAREPDTNWLFAVRRWRHNVDLGASHMCPSWCPHPEQFRFRPTFPGPRHAASTCDGYDANHAHMHERQLINNGLEMPGGASSTTSEESSLHETRNKHLQSRLDLPKPQSQILASTTGSGSSRLHSL